MSVNAAMEWLLTHPDEATGDAAEASCKEGNKPDPDVRSKKTDFTPKLHQQTTGRKQSRAQTILESFRAYKRRKFKPNVIAVNSLIDMGFEESDVLEALRLTSNDQEAACEWLLGDRNQTNVCDTLEDGIEQSSPLYQAIITNPVVQLGLSNPRCLLAFLHILENGTNLISNDWFRDPDVGPALVHISRIYQAEKKSDFMFPGYSDG